jgi:hypothetical protein
MDGVVGIDLYRQSLELVFEKGRLSEVRDGISPGVPRLRMPPFLLAPLVLGYRSASVLASFYHDVSVPEELVEIVQVLFPPLRAWVAQQY